LALTARYPNETEVSEWCVAHLAKALRRAPEKIDPQTKFSRLGVDSAMAVYLVAELEEWLGRELSPEVAFEYRSIAELAHHLASEPD
jgi:acyl carrier protein